MVTLLVLDTAYGSEVPLLCSKQVTDGSEAARFASIYGSVWLSWARKWSVESSTQRPVRRLRDTNNIQSLGRNNAASSPYQNAADVVVQSCDNRLSVENTPPLFGSFHWPRTGSLVHNSTVHCCIRVVVVIIIIVV
jgi:hypothetical protein